MKVWGPAGEKGATQAAYHGYRVAVVERRTSGNQEHRRARVRPTRLRVRRYSKASTSTDQVVPAIGFTASR
jgi:hypothetical protein